VNRYGRLGSLQTGPAARPGLAEAHNNLAWVYHRQAHYPEPSNPASRPSDSSPTLPRRTTTWKRVCALKKYDQAVEAYKQAYAWSSIMPKPI